MSSAAISCRDFGGRGNEGRGRVAEEAAGGREQEAKV